VGRSSGGALPLFPHRACSTISRILRTKVYIGMRQRACSRRPADFYAGLRHCPLVWRWWFSRGVGSNKDATTTTASTSPRRARSNREDYAELKLALAVSNNVGVEIAKIFFASVAYCLWCARRAIAFIVISMSWRDSSNKKVHFRSKSTFQNGVPGAACPVPFPERSRRPAARSVSRLTMLY
jgi:hypothetical protein